MLLIHVYGSSFNIEANYIIDTMSESGEECELQQLVPPSEEGKSGEVTPPDNPVGKVTVPSPAINKDMASTYELLILTIEMLVFMVYVNLWYIFH